MKKPIILLCMAGLMIQSASASVYRLSKTMSHAESTDTTQLTARDSVIVLDSDMPESLDVMGLRFDMTRKYSSQKTGEKSWVEYYAVPEYGYRVRLTKDTERGVTAITVRDRNKNLFLYEPEDAPVPVSYVPPILVRQVEHKYLDSKGELIVVQDGRPSENWIKKMDTDMEYQSFTADSTMLYIRITDRFGKLRKGRGSQGDYSYVTSIMTKKTETPEMIYIGRWEKKLKKYDRFEICDSQGRQLLCTPIPIKGTTIPIPIFSRCTCPVCQSRPRKRRDDPHKHSYYMTLYIKGAIGSHIPGRGVLEGWREQEVD